MENKDVFGLEYISKCPVCGSNILINNIGIEWCTSYECTWSSNKDIEEFMMYLYPCIPKDRIVYLYELFAKLFNQDMKTLEEENCHCHSEECKC